MFKQILVADGSTSGAASAAARELKTLDSCAELHHFHLDSAKPGDVLDEMLHRAVELRADLVVVGARRHVVASRAAMLAPCSVLMAPDDSYFSLSRVLAPVDFSETSADALRLGARLAALRNGECMVVAVECDDDPWLDWENEPDLLAEKLAQFADAAARPFPPERCIVEPVRRSAGALKNGGLSFAHKIEGADVAATIIDVARREGSTLIVLGTRGRSKSASILLGSVTEKVAQLSPIPVLAVKRAGGQLGLLKGILERIRRKQPTQMAS